MVFPRSFTVTKKDHSSCQCFATSASYWVSLKPEPVEITFNQMGGMKDLLYIMQYKKNYKITNYHIILYEN